MKLLYVGQGVWEEKKPLLLEELKNGRYMICYRSILIQEDEKKLLLEAVKEQPFDLFYYGKFLVKEYPEEDVDKAVEAYKKLNENYVKEAGMEMSDFLKAQGMSEEDYEEDCQQYAESKVEQNLIVQGIMDAEGLSLDDDDIQTLKDELLSEYGYESFDQLVAYYGEQEVNESLALMRVERFIVDNATVNETSATEADVANEDADPESEDTGVDAVEDTTEDNASEEDSSDTAEESEETASEDDVANEG